MNPSPAYFISLSCIVPSGYPECVKYIGESDSSDDSIDDETPKPVKKRQKISSDSEDGLDANPTSNDEDGSGYWGKESLHNSVSDSSLWNSDSSTSTSCQLTSKKRKPTGTNNLISCNASWSENHNSFDMVSRLQLEWSRLS